MGNWNDSEGSKRFEQFATNNPVAALFITAVLLSSGVSGGISGLFNKLIDHRKDPWTGTDAERQETKVLNSVASSIATERTLREAKDRELDRRLQEALQAIEAYWRLYGAQERQNATQGQKIEHNTQAIHDLQKQLKELTDLLRPIR